MMQSQQKEMRSNHEILRQTLTKKINEVDFIGSPHSLQRHAKTEPSKKLHIVQVEKFNTEQDGYFIKHILTPYLSSVYYSLINRTNKDYLGIKRTKQYLNMPDLIGERLVW